MGLAAFKGSAKRPSLFPTQHVLSGQAHDTGGFGRGHEGSRELLTDCLSHDPRCGATGATRGVAVPGWGGGREGGRRVPADVPILRLLLTLR